MAISKAYQDTLKRRAIKRFITDNRRSPTESELKDLIYRERRNYPSVDQVGVSGYDITKPQFQEASSAESENINRRALMDDMVTIGTRIDSLIQKLEDGYRSFTGTARRTKRMLTQIESRLDNLLLLNSNIDEFVYGIEETFDIQDKINFTDTTASVESGYVTMGRAGYAPVELTDARLTYSVTSEKGIIGSQNTSKAEHLKENDGTLWEHLVYTRYQQGRVSLVIEVDLDEPKYINDFRFTGIPIAVNQHMTATVFYSLDGQTYTALEPAEVAVTAEEQHFNLGLDGVQKIRLMLSKGVADNVTTTDNQHVYVFSLDSIKILADKYTSDAVSELYAGPYEVVDELGNPVYFTKAACEACVVTNDDTSVNFFLSKDNLNWIGTNYQGNSLNYASFSNGAQEGSYEIIDLTKSANALIESTEDLEDLDLGHEALINLKIPEEWVDTVPVKSIEVKRNLVQQDVDVYDVSSGWYFDEHTKQYSTTVYIDAPEGRYIDLGPTGAYVNGNLVSGQVLFRQGYTTFATADTNWYPIAKNISTLRALKRADPLYPYNHKYLIEGYVYAGDYTSERVYNGVEEYFGRLLQYIPPEEFNSEETHGNLGIYTLDNPSGDMFFKVKVDKTDASWINEQFEVNWAVAGDSSNLLYVKAVLTASDDGLSPVIEKFGVRVI